MNLNQFKKLVAKIDKKYNGLMFGVKNKDYARNDDKLWNFKRAGMMEDSTPEYALRGMLTKHLTSIYDMIDDLEISGIYHDLDKWDEKLGDAINYFKLLRALLQERYEESEE